MWFNSQLIIDLTKPSRNRTWNTISNIILSTFFFSFFFYNFPATEVLILNQETLAVLNAKPPTATLDCWWSILHTNLGVSLGQIFWHFYKILWAVISVSSILDLAQTQHYLLKTGQSETRFAMGSSLFSIWFQLCSSSMHRQLPNMLKIICKSSPIQSSKVQLKNIRMGNNG